MQFVLETKKNSIEKVEKNKESSKREALPSKVTQREKERKKLAEERLERESSSFFFSPGWDALSETPFSLLLERTVPMLRLALAASKRGAASAVVESVLPSSSSAAAAAATAFTRSFAALPATTTSEPSSPFLRFASPAPAAHDFTPALQGLPETKVKK